MTIEPFSVAVVEATHTLAKVLRSRLHESLPSWAVVRRLVESRKVLINGTVCTDSARRLKEGELIEVLANSVHRAKSATPDGLVIRYLDDHIVVVEKPSGLNTVRHPSELEWSDKRRELVPTLQDIAQVAVAKQVNRSIRQLSPLRIVHRLDRETSGLLTFARTPLAERGLGMQFRKHTVVRRYLAIVPGFFTAQTIQSSLVKDRGDGRRGSTTLARTGKVAITHIEIEERLPSYTLLSCRLETGRTHQIRIHLSEAGHPVSGDKVYCRKQTGELFFDASTAKRLMLHATELGYIHPITEEKLFWEMPMPADMKHLVERLRKPAPKRPNS